MFECAYIHTYTLYDKPTPCIYRQRNFSAVRLLIQELDIEKKKPVTGSDKVLFEERFYFVETGPV